MWNILFKNVTTIDNFLTNLNIFSIELEQLSPKIGLVNVLLYLKHCSSLPRIFFAKPRAFLSSKNYCKL